MGLLGSFNSQNMMAAFNDPLFQIGVSLLARRDQNIGQALGGAMGDLGRIQEFKEQSVLRKQRAETFKEERERAKQEAEQQAAMQQRVAEFVSQSDDPSLQTAYQLGGAALVQDVWQQQQEPVKMPMSYQEHLLAQQDPAYAAALARKQAASGMKVEIGGPQYVDQTAYQKEMGKQWAKQDIITLEKARSARQSLNRIEQFRYLVGKMKEAGTEPNRLAPLQTELAAFAQALGADPDKIGFADAGPGQALIALSNEMTLGKIGGEDGMPANNFSDADRKFVTSTVPRIENSVQGVELKLQIQELLDRRALEHEQFFLNNGHLKPFERQREWAKYVDNNPLFDDFEGDNSVSPTDDAALEAELRRRGL